MSNYFDLLFCASARPDYRAEALCSRSVRSSVTILVNPMSMDTNGPRGRAMTRLNFGSQEVKGQGHIRSKIWRPGGGIIHDPFGLSGFSSFIGR